MRLLLIRHGQTIDNVRGALGTEVPGPPLTELGRKQADAVPAALESEQIEAIYVSTMLRTQLTAAPLARARGIDARVVDGLQEIYAGELEQRADSASVHQYIGAIVAWQSDLRVRIPGGEDGHEFFARYNAVIDDIAADHDGTVALVSHGAAIRTWASWAAGNIDGDFTRIRGLDNTGVVILEGSPTDGWLATQWEGEPIGGESLADADAPDPTGEASAS
ncbi:histidine phosphatase family protein [Leifsonia sp. Root112D2]|uniref:histidine phosphatase family protein n=1 Tax=Leifsonia sp. Root112D2 TaxID=1736426 RepID=UPI0006F7A91B|nr:histidine phosphatase family protein [Leifsonia sp. Root112D2]KQV07408.1 histidine phosphatase [Leifsonia sp. Root112D2]